MLCKSDICVFSVGGSVDSVSECGEPFPFGVLRHAPGRALRAAGSPHPPVGRAPRAPGSPLACNPSGEETQKELHGTTRRRRPFLQALRGKIDK